MFTSVFIASRITSTCSALVTTSPTEHLIFHTCAVSDDVRHSPPLSASGGVVVSARDYACASQIDGIHTCHDRVRSDGLLSLEFFPPLSIPFCEELAFAVVDTFAISSS